jgi:hypothetical protein
VHAGAGWGFVVTAPSLPRRLRVLMGAFGCEPKRGSEPEVGYRALMAAAARCDVHLLTIPGSAAVLEEDLAGHPLRERITIEPGGGKPCIRGMRVTSTTCSAISPQAWPGPGFWMTSLISRWMTSVHRSRSQRTSTPGSGLPSSM